MAYLSNFFSSLLVTTIRGYQKTLSLDHGPLRRFYPDGFCRFYPSCSQYTIDSIHCHGPLRGCLRAAGRIVRCNPLSKGGYDPAR